MKEKLKLVFKIEPQGTDATKLSVADETPDGGNLIYHFGILMHHNDPTQVINGLRSLANVIEQRMTK